MKLSKMIECTIKYFGHIEHTKIMSEMLAQNKIDIS